MADTKMSGFAPLTPVTGPLGIPCFLSGDPVNYKITADDLVDYTKTQIELEDILAVNNITGAEKIIFSTETASRVAGLNGSKELVSLSTPLTKLAYIDNVTGDIQDQLDDLFTIAAQFQSGFYWKETCRLATTSNINLASVPSSIDSVSWNEDDRILVKNQTNDEENGIYVGNGAGGLDRAADFVTGQKIAGAVIEINEGAVNEDTMWRCTTDVPAGPGGVITIGTDPVNFEETANTTLTGTTNRITVALGVIDIAATYVGQTSIVTVGHISTGEWKATSIPTAYTDAKIKGAIGADVGAIPYGTGTANEVTSLDKFLYKASCLGVSVTSDPLAIVDIKGSIAGIASLCLRQGVAVSAPNEGDFWHETINNRLMIRAASTREILSASAVTTESLVSDTTLTIKFNGVTYKLLAVA